MINIDLLDQAGIGPYGAYIQTKFWGFRITYLSMGHDTPEAANAGAIRFAESKNYYRPRLPWWRFGKRQAAQPILLEPAEKTAEKIRQAQGQLCSS